MSEGIEDGAVPAQNAPGRSFRQSWAILLPLANLVWIVFFLSDYTNVWVAPEANAWRGHFSKSFTASETVQQAFNWHVFEVLPRLTRPLSSLMETLDNSIRKRLWKTWTPHPTLSITYLFTLVLIPVLLYRVLRALGVKKFIAWCGIALYLSNPGVLSLLAMGFRPGKAMACAATVVALWWASRLERVSLLRVVPLYLFVLLSLFWDEIALIAFPALLLLFPRVVFASRATAGTFFLIPIGYAMAVRWLLPAIHAAAGFPVAAGESFWPLDNLTKWVTLGSSSGATDEFRKYSFSNSRIALMDSLGLIDPTLAGSTVYYAVFGATVSCLAVFGFWIARRIVALRSNPRRQLLGAGVVLRSAAFLVVSLVFHEVLLSVVRQQTWGLYWYGVFISLAFVIAVSTLLEHLRVQSWFAAFFVVMVSAGSFYIFPATNRAYKNLHYYPYRAIMLRSVFENRINRFNLAGPSSSSEEMRRYTRELARNGKEAPNIAAPAELLYVVYELGLNSGGEDCATYHPTFSLTTSAEGPRLDCHEANLRDDEVKEFLGDWRTPAIVAIKPNNLFVVLERTHPIVARVDGTKIELVERKLTGRLSADGRSLLWANGTTWERRSGDISSLEGKWWSGATVWIRKPKNTDVLIGSDTYAGMIQPGGTILAPERGTAGTLTSDHRRIIWSQGGEWIRQNGYQGR